MHHSVLYNDDIVPSTEPLLRVGQLGLLSGWGVFTTLRIYEGVPFAFELHWRRLSRDAELLRVPLGQAAEHVYARLLGLIDVNGAREAACRLCVVRNEGGYWAGPGSGRSSDVIAFTNDLQPQKECVSLSTVRNVRHTAFPFAGTKSLSWAHSLVLVEAARTDGFDEVILLNERDEVTECTSANLFAVKEGVICTAPLSCGASPGVTRAVVLQELDPAGVPVIEKPLCLEDLYEADEVFITSTSRELIPVARIHDRMLAGSAAGWPVMHRLRQALRDYIRAYIDAQNVLA